jgi:hypothetical protein
MVDKLPVALDGRSFSPFALNIINPIFGSLRDRYAFAGRGVDALFDIDRDL